MRLWYDEVYILPIWNMFQKCTFFRTAHHANLKHVSEWHMFQSGTQHTHPKQPVIEHVVQWKSVGLLLGPWVLYTIMRKVGTLWFRRKIDLSPPTQCWSSHVVRNLARSPNNDRFWRGRIMIAFDFGEKALCYRRYNFVVVVVLFLFLFFVFCFF